MKCTFAHTEEDVTAAPNLRGTKQCWAFNTKYGCRKGNSCTFAHRIVEATQRPGTFSCAPEPLVLPESPEAELAAHKLPLADIARSEPVRSPWVPRGDVVIIDACVGQVLGQVMGTLSRQTTGGSTREPRSSVILPLSARIKKSEEVDDEEDLDEMSRSMDSKSGLRSPQSSSAASHRSTSWAEVYDDASEQAGEQAVSFESKSSLGNFFKESPSRDWARSAGQPHSAGQALKSSYAYAYASETGPKKAWADLLEDDSDEEGVWPASTSASGNHLEMEVSDEEFQFSS